MAPSISTGLGKAAVKSVMQLGARAYESAATIASTTAVIKTTTGKVPSVTCGCGTAP